jgi:hypothetical protein
MDREYSGFDFVSIFAICPFRRNAIATNFADCRNRQRIMKDHNSLNCRGKFGL